VLRPKYVEGQVKDPAMADYNVGWLEIGEWLNYAGKFPAGRSNPPSTLSRGWSPVANQSNPYTASPTGTRFYRLVRP
jgi:hypothetical protein